jgi:segregation and condensation protein A
VSDLLRQGDLPITPPVAYIHGQPMAEMPQDLYIPPDALEVALESFQGPLDLLLYLIRRHNLDPLDIPMAQLTLQYIGYIEAMKQHRMELAAEYLLMAAVLIEIKSRMLLPRPPKENGGESEEDPRVELMRRLLEYEQMKLAAHKLNDLPQAGRDFQLVQVLIERTVIERLPSVSIEDLQNAWLALLTRAKVNASHTVRREELSVREQMSKVLRQLRNCDFVPFEQLFATDAGIPMLVVTFIAILELAKETLIEITQTESLGNIYVRTSRAITAE